MFLKRHQTNQTTRFQQAQFTTVQARSKALAPKMDVRIQFAGYLIWCMEIPHRSTTSNYAEKRKYKTHTWSRLSTRNENKQNVSKGWCHSVLTLH